jgi:hypothetical protein
MGFRSLIFLLGAQGDNGIDAPGAAGGYAGGENHA